MVTRDIIVNGSMLIEISIMSHIIIEISIEWHNNQYGHMSRHCAEQGFQALDTPNLITKPHLYSACSMQAYTFVTAIIHFYMQDYCLAVVSYIMHWNFMNTPRKIT